MKRRLSALLCALTLALSLSGCWSGDVSDDSSGDFWEETPPVEADTSSTLTPITSFALPYLQGVTPSPAPTACSRRLVRCSTRGFSC